MTREEAIKLLQVEQECDDPEGAHINADKILCEFLISLGYADVVAEWDKVKMWYS